MASGVILSKVLNKILPKVLGDGGGISGSLIGAPAKNLYALTGFSATSFMQTAVGGGEAGVATGFGGAQLFRVRSTAVSAPRVLFEQKFGNTGYTLYTTTAQSALVLEVRDAANGLVTTSIALTASDSGRIMLAAFQHTGSAVRLLLFRERSPAGDLAITGYSLPTGAPTYLGSRGANFPFDVGDVMASMTWRGVPSVAQLQTSLFDAARTLGDLPKTIDGATVTHRWSLRDQLLKAGGTVVDGQAAPAQLDDTVTGLANDALAKVGTGLTVKKVDTSIDGRTTKGVLGFSAAAYLEAAAGKGIVGAANALTVQKYVTPEGALTTAYAAGTLAQPSGFTGWQLSITPTRIVWAISDGSGAAVAITVTGLALASMPSLVTATWDGSFLRVYVNDVAVGTPLAVTGFTPGTTGMRIGDRPGPTSVPFVGSWWTTQGGNIVASLADVQASYAELVRTGKPGRLPGAQHYYDALADIAANGGELPATFLDRIGTDHLARLDVDVPKVGPNGIRSVGPYTTSDAWRSAPGGGIQGSAGGFHVVVDWVPTALPTATSRMVDCNVAANDNLWTLQGLAGGGVRLYFNNASCGFYAVQASDIGKRLRFVVNFTGTLASLWVNGPNVGSGNVGYTPNALAVMQIGGKNGTEPWLFGSVELVQGGNFALTGPEIAALCADLTQSAPLVPGKTEKRYRLHDDTAATPTKTPRTSVERIAGLSADTLTRYGAGLQLAQRTERLWSYETSPILYGAQAFSPGDYYETAVGLLGDVGGFWGAILLIVRSQSVPSTGRVLLSRRSTGSSGWNAASNTTNATLSAVISTSISTYATPALAIAAADVGKLILFGWSMDVPSLKLRGYGKRVEVGGGTTIAGNYVPLPAGTMQLGRRNGDGVPADAGLEIYGFTCGNGVPTLAEFQALHDACMATEDIQAMPGRSDITVSLKRDAQANGGVLPAVLLDRSGNSNFARNGSPVLASQYARAWGW